MRLEAARERDGRGRGAERAAGLYQGRRPVEYVFRVPGLLQKIPAKSPVRPNHQLPRPRLQLFLASSWHGVQVSGIGWSGGRRPSIPQGTARNPCLLPDCGCVTLERLKYPVPLWYLGGRLIAVGIGPQTVVGRFHSLGTGRRDPSTCHGHRARLMVLAEDFPNPSSRWPGLPEHMCGSSASAAVLHAGATFGQTGVRFPPRLPTYLILRVSRR